MISIPRGLYMTVEEYRQLLGYETRLSIYRAIKSGRLPGAILVEGRTYLIPNTACIIKRKRGRKKNEQKD